MKNFSLNYSLKGTISPELMNLPDKSGEIVACESRNRFVSSLHAKPYTLKLAIT